VAEGQRHATRSLSALAEGVGTARGRWRRPMGARTGKRQRPCADMDNARSLDQSCEGVTVLVPGSSAARRFLLLLTNERTLLPLAPHSEGCEIPGSRSIEGLSRKDCLIVWSCRRFSMRLWRW